MARPLRIYFEGAWYHVMNRGIRKEDIFYNDSHRYAFLYLLGKAKDIYGIEIHAYCLMSNHYHLIIHTPRGNISEAMKYINSTYAQIFNSSMKRDGPIFRGRFRAIIISADEYLIRLSRYIHLNPLKAKLVSDLVDYKWSSYPSYLERTQFPEWLTKTEIIKRFGKKSFRLKYINYVENSNDEQLEKFYQSRHFNPTLGGDEFSKFIENLKSHSLSGEIVGADRIKKPPSIQKIIRYTSKYFNVEVESIFKINKVSGNLPRQLVIFISRNSGGYSLREIANAIGNINYKGISKAIARVNSDKTQQIIANKIIRSLENSS